MNIINIGLIIDFLGVIVLLWVAIKTRGTTTPADEDQIISRFYKYSGYVLLAVGFLLQIIGNSIGAP